MNSYNVQGIVTGNKDDMKNKDIFSSQNEKKIEQHVVNQGQVSFTNQTLQG